MLISVVVTVALMLALLHPGGRGHRRAGTVMTHAGLVAQDTCPNARMLLLVVDVDQVRVVIHSSARFFISATDTNSVDHLVVVIQLLVR